MIREAVQRWLFRGNAPPIEREYPKQRDNVVSTYEGTGIYTQLIGGEKYNPDDLIAQKGLGIYAKMLNDEQVKSVTEFKLNAILGRGWHFKFDQTKLAPDEQKKRIRVFEAITKKIRGSFLDAIEGVASGREFGYSVSEKVYGQITYDGATFKGLNMILTRDPASFRFFADEYGLLTKITQRVAGRADVDVNLDKVVHYVHKPKWDSVYGRSELRAAYRAWYLKDITLKLWALHLERFGSGIPVATRTGQEGAAYGTPEYASLQRVMENFKAHTGIILPPGFTAEVLFPTSTDQFEKALQYHDLAIAKSQLVPNLLGLSHTGQTGAYSQSQTQFEAFFWTTSTDGSRISECLNEQVFRDLGDQNWGDGDYPYFCFKPMTLENAIKLLTAFKDMTGAGLATVTEDDERFLRELLEMPERTEDSEPLIDPMTERQQVHTEEQAKVANDLKQQELDQKAKQPAANASQYTQAPITVTVHNPAPTVPTPTPGILPATHAGHMGAEVVPHGRLRSASVAQFTRAAQRVAFSVIERRTDDLAESAVPSLAGIIAKATARALGDDANMRALTDEDPSDVAAIDLPAASRGKLKTECRDLLVQSWTLGSNMAANELDRARGERTELTLRRMQFVSLRDNAGAYFDTQSFRMAGDTSDATRKIIQQELQNGIKFGKAIPEIRIAIWERLVSKGLTTMSAVKAAETSEGVLDALAELGLADVEDVAAYLNTLVRTNTFEALNEARFAEFTDPQVAEFVMAMEYAAVLDSSTTEICRELNGRVYRSDSPEWDEIRPPNHFNCRSVLVPVTTIDGWDGQESERPDVEPADGFG
jgi:SPP1 gp7 family putative phage head morphogenesis protein